MLHFHKTNEFKRNTPKIENAFKHSAPGIIYQVQFYH
jgi:hypothetical protein